MKIKNINLKIPNDNIILLGALGLIVLNSGFVTTGTNSALPVMYEVDSQGNPIQNVQTSSNYIDKVSKALSVNNYSAIKTLYKLQSVLDDIGAISFAEEAQYVAPSLNMTDVLSEITPFLSDSRKATVSGIADNIKKTRKTLDQIGNAKNRIASLPQDTPRSERIKAIINEIPAISGIPILDNLNNIKSLLSLIKPEGSETKNASESETQNSSDYDDIYELVDLLEKDK